MSTPHPQQAPSPVPPQGAPQQGAPYDHGQGLPGAAYTSPIPIKRTHLGNAIVSEWTKIRSVRSTVWTITIFLLLVVGTGLIIAANTKAQDYAEVPYTLPAFFGLILGQICLITLGVLVVSSEYGTGMIRTTMTASPQRSRVLAAKFLVFFVVAFTVSALAIGLVGLFTSGMHDDGSVESVPMGGTLLKGSLYVSLLGVLALAVGALLRHSAGAITAMLGLVLVPAILPAFLMISESTRDIGEKMLEYNAPNSLAKVFQLESGSGGGTPQLWLLAGITVAAIVGAFIRLESRDV
ncbi:ABC-2 family transporter protein [Streptomyces sp. YIM 130001]|uniref:ABC transporter permease n=1 Tax=Streptomyces sp. YIM 130001 TaxID=2259644 RepID=UPI000EDABDF3|nr:ABC transporter permease [Streptomyces sp. YIM 130001]RII15739.1 ABC-2 family transporter protein [Streptomyces sp. YIM 130001]